MVVDGEVAILDANGKIDFQALQKYIKNPTGDMLVYTVFDLLALSGSDLRNNRLIDRQALLEKLLRDSPENLHFSSHTSGNGKQILLAYILETGISHIYLAVLKYFTLTPCYIFKN